MGIDKAWRRVLVGLLLLAGWGPGNLWGQSTLDLLEQKARSTYRSDLDSSRHYCDRILELGLAGDAHEKVAFAYNWKAICFLKNGLADSVDHYLDLAIDYSQAHEVPEVEGKARLNKSINAHFKGDYEASVSMGLNALRHFESIGDSLGMAHAYYNTGLSYQRMERPEQARKFYRNALPIYLERGGILDRANTFNALGTLWDDEGELDSARACFEASVEVKLSVNAWAYCGSEYSNLAALYKQQGDTTVAESYYARSFAAYDAIGDLRGKALVAGNLSELMYHSEKWDSAIYYGNISLEFADTTADRYLLELSHHRLSIAHQAMGQFEEALRHNQIEDSLSQELASIEVQKNIDELHVRYETEKRERELAEAQVVSQRKSFFLVGSLVGIGLLLLSFALWYRSEQEKKKRLVVQGRINLESERNRISMDLHDHLGAELTIITSQLDTQAFRTEDAQLGTALESISDQVREANALLRETIWSVRGTRISLGQFAGKVREFAQRLLEGSGIQFDHEQEGEADLNPALALALFRVVQEAIHNAFKYSGGSSVRFVAKADGKELVLVVADDGQGFDPEAAATGYGLANMRDRVQQVGGSLEMVTREGTRIHIRVPLKA